MSRGARLSPYELTAPLRSGLAEKITGAEARKASSADALSSAEGRLACRRLPPSGMPNAPPPRRARAAAAAEPSADAAR